MYRYRETQIHVVVCGAVNDEAKRIQSGGRGKRALERGRRVLWMPRGEPYMRGVAAAPR